MTDLDYQEEVHSQSHTGGWQGSLRGGWGIADPPALPSSKLDTASKLLLIGTVHGDPQGYDRAWKLLRDFQPDLVTVEVSYFSLRYRQRREGLWQRRLQQALAELPSGAAMHLAIRRLAAQVALPFEVRVARDYARGSGIPWRPLDLGGPARRHLPRYDRELLSPENLRALLETADEPLEDYVSGEYRRAQMSCRRPLWRPLGVNPETVRRERFLARRLRRHLAKFSRVAHLGGWEHLVPWRQATGLWQELADLKPLRFFLDEADGG